MSTFKKPGDLAKQIIIDLASLRTQTVIISIDGNDNVGKTWLANKLSPLLSAPVVSLDDYVSKKKDGYVPFLKVRDIQERLSTGEPRFIIEGVCLLAAARRCGFRVHKLIYVKRMSPYGDWLDAEECGSNQDPGKIIDKLSEDMRKFAGFMRQLVDEKTGNADINDVDLSEPRKEIIRYHANYKPIDQADYEFHRVEG